MLHNYTEPCIAVPGSPAAFLLAAIKTEMMEQLLNSGPHQESASHEKLHGSISCKFRADRNPSHI